MRSRPTISTYVCGSLVAVGLQLFFFVAPLVVSVLSCYVCYIVIIVVSPLSVVLEACGLRLGLADIVLPALLKFGSSSPDQVPKPEISTVGGGLVIDYVRSRTPRRAALMISVVWTLSMLISLL